MFQRFASALFGDDAAPEPSRRHRRDVEPEAEEDEDWILVNFLADSCSSQRVDSLSGSAVGREEDCDDDDDDDLVMIPSPVASPPIRYASCTSLNSTADTDPDGGGEDDEGEEEEESDFLRLDASSLEESWFVTPPPCFTGRGVQSVLVETSPLENLLIEHPSMSVYAHHSPPRLNPTPLQRSLDLELSAAPKEKGRRALDGVRHRPDVSVQRRAGLHQSACYAAALCPRAGLLPQRPGLAGQPLLSRNALRRLNLLHPPKAGAPHLHQPSQRHLNF
ncbi:tumor protein p53-inducible nuclear protein 1 [Syngnathoides biaculeatus]|uniref:tumor protein p53-inducible nuclear protein 1 n=1 Tax=Syngnathoides biaculeatus TaxID=300417 RepID=UPI002ADDCD42|nr:tumor protein p53-inducible nuclear protein 1 [Syngnathoides biaculeatus]XP_061676530.1 tumor protein p53-inducible nuclear protein 1 [Syngnathoides biaculeatus]XP_061676531.1 tumor protein p53-inducible nuclear protein 1 [Syngnathoides biaculeatus]XP_061676532.1 tumor protein p53-inducible nuclear protein 1 [Syngnathoides biaculeatus]XP_061676533.1 tumor protein p53-inducible nuclear protein 1 [Syngnathoides biaculeatus]